MAKVALGNRTQWLKIEPGERDDTPYFFKQEANQAAEMNDVFIGQWYYYLWLHDQQIDLCRNQRIMGLSSFPEVVEHSQLAISDEDLEYAVQYQSYGTFEPGYYRISPVIERKLRIIFE